MNGIIYWILMVIFAALGGYSIGLRRGIKVSDSLYDEGYVNGWNDCLKETSEDDDEDKYEKARKMIRELDELFNDEDEDEIIGGDEY